MSARKPPPKDDKRSPRVVFAAELARLRAESGWSFRELADKVGWDHAHLHHMEHGRSIGGQDVVEALDTVYGTTPLLVRLWEMAREGATFREKYQRYMELEAEAVAIDHYAGSFLPGVLQTEPYARDLLWSTPHSVQEEPALEEQLVARMSRKDLLARDSPPFFRVVLDEAVLRRPMTDGEQWRGVLRHLIEAGSQPHVSVQVLPNAAGLHALLGGSLTLLRRAGGLTAAFLESAKEGELIEDADKVEQVRLSYDALRDVTLSPRDSMAFIATLMEDDPPCTCPRST